MRKKYCIVLAVMFLFIGSFISIKSVQAAENKKAIVVVPGMMESNLKNSDGKVVWLSDEWIGGSKQIYYFTNGSLKCTDDGKSKKEITPVSGPDEYGTKNNFEKLITTLKGEFGADNDIIFYAYDWRLDNGDNAEQLNEIIKKYDKVSIVAHSMGGLLVNKYLSSYSTDNIQDVITLGAPFWGSLDAAQSLYSGEVTTLTNKIIKTAMKDIIRENELNYSSVYEMLPNTCYSDACNWLITDKKTRNHLYDYIWSQPEEKLNNTAETEQFKMDNFNQALVKNAQQFHKELYKDISPIEKVNHTIIVGSGLDTVNTMKLATTKILGYNLRVAIPKSYNSGDGMVSLISATMGGNLDYIERPGIDHFGLLSDDETISIILKSLKDTENTSYMSKTFNSLLGYDFNSNKAETGLEEDQVKAVVDPYKLTFSGDINFEAVNNGKDMYYIHKAGNDLDINQGNKFKINTLVNDDINKIFLINFGDDNYNFKFKSNKEQIIDIAIGPNDKIYAFNKISLTSNSILYLNSNMDDGLEILADYDGDGTIDETIKPSIEDVTE